MSKDLIIDPQYGVWKSGGDDEKPPRYEVYKNFTNQEVDHNDWLGSIRHNAWKNGISSKEFTELCKKYIGDKICDNDLIELDRAIADIIKKRRK